MIEFTNGDISDVIADVTMMLDAAVPEYQRLRATFPQVTNEAIWQMMQRIVNGPPIAPEEELAPLVYNFARFRLAHAAATDSRGQLREGTPDAQAVRRAYLGTCDALGALGAILREVKGVRYAAVHLGESMTAVVKQKKSSKRGRDNLAEENAFRDRKADRDALRAVSSWRRDPLRKNRLGTLSHADVVTKYLETGSPTDRQGRRLRKMLRAGRLKK